MGPIAAGMYGMEPPVDSGLHDYNPRCIRRDLNAEVSRKFYTTANLLNLTIDDASGTVELFQNEFNGRPQDNGFMGLRKIPLPLILFILTDLPDSAGHYTINGENTDFYTSVNDPAFFLHHAMIDNIFWIWQALHPEESTQVAGTRTLMNNPPLGNAAIYDPLVMGVNAPTRKIYELQDTLSGDPLCYIYE